MKLKLKYLDFDRICRLCIGETESCLYHDVNVTLRLGTLDISLAGLLEKYINFKISKNDGKPQNICESCITQLCQCHNFFEMCSNSNATFDKALSLKYVKLWSDTENNDNFEDENIDNIHGKIEVHSETEDINKLLNHERNPEGKHEIHSEIEDTNKSHYNNFIKVEDSDVQFEDVIQSEIGNMCEVNVDISEVNNCPEEITVCFEDPDAHKSQNSIDQELRIIEYFSTLEESIDCTRNTMSETDIITNEENFRNSVIKNTPKGNHQCPRCGALFEYVQNYRRHVRIHHGYQPGCPICGRIFTTNMSLKMHIQTIHQKIRSANSEKALMRVKNYMKLKKRIGKKEIDEQEGRAQDTKCKYCKLEFNTVLGRKVHESRHLAKTEFICRRCYKVFPSNEERNDHLNSVHIKFKCEECGKGFATDANYRMHVNTHKTALRCTICDLQLKSQTILKSHMLIHTGEKPFKCDQCDKTFRQPSHLRYHKYLHSGKKPFQCHLCEKTFGTRSYLETHVRMHTGERPFFCEICGKTSHDRVALRRHLKTHKKERVTVIPNDLESEIY